MDHNIDRLRFAALELLLRLSRRIPRKRASTIFLVNNLHHIVQVPSSPPIHAEKALHANKQAKHLSQAALLRCSASSAAASDAYTICWLGPH